MIRTALHLYYLPRSTMYKIDKHNVKVKTSEGWVLGCIYTDQIKDTTYVRPYEMFDISKWIGYNTPTTY